LDNVSNSAIKSTKTAKFNATGKLRNLKLTGKGKSYYN